MIKALKKVSLVIAVVCFVFSLNSCISYKKIPYFQDLDTTQVQIPVSLYSSPVIQKNDMLGIYISSLSESTATLFAVPPSEADVYLTTNGGGFLVNEKGEIAMKTLGTMLVQGLSTLQLQQLLLEKVSAYVNNPTVVVRINNFRVSVNGDVANAGVYNVPTGKINLLEALSLAGDLKLTGKRENILVLRENKPGEMKAARIDLTSKKVFSSPYFFLQNNDVIYVEPDVRRLQRDENFYKNISVFASVISILSLTFIRLTR